MPDDGDPDHDQVEITVKVGEQSAVYDKKFDYHIQTVVTTLCGRPGTSGVKVGTLAKRNSLKSVSWLLMPKIISLYVRANCGEPTN